MDATEAPLASHASWQFRNTVHVRVGLWRVEGSEPEHEA